MRDNDLRLLVEKTNKDLQEKELSLIKKEGLDKLQKLEEAMSVGQKMMKFAPNKIDKARDEYFAAGKDDPEALAAIDTMPVPWNPSARSQKSGLLKRTVGKDAIDAPKPEGLKDQIGLLKNKMMTVKSKEEADRIMDQINYLMSQMENEPETKVKEIFDLSIGSGGNSGDNSSGNTVNKPQ